jgi:hypothetical protein
MRVKEVVHALVARVRPIFDASELLSLDQATRRASEFHMTSELPIGRALRRFRRLNMVKQSAVAECLAALKLCVEVGERRPQAGYRAKGSYHSAHLRISRR